MSFFIKHKKVKIPRYKKHVIIKNHVFNEGIRQGLFETHEQLATEVILATRRTGSLMWDKKKFKICNGIKTSYPFLQTKRNECLCVFTNKAGKFCTIPIKISYSQITVKTVFESSNWQIKKYRKMKRNIK